MKKIIVTGGPCVGKTTTINLLKDSSTHIIDESARFIIESEQKKKADNPQHDAVLPWIASKFDDFQNLVIKEQLSRESSIPANASTVLLDRSLVDILGYCKVANKTPPKEVFEHIKNAGYSKVIFLEQLSSYEKDSARKEDAILAKKIHTELLNAYKEQGFDVLVVPAFEGKPNERAEFIKKHIK